MKRALVLYITLIGLSLTSQAQIWQSLNGGLKHTPLAMTEFNNTLAVAYQTADNGSKGNNFGISVWTGAVWKNYPEIKCDSGAKITCIKQYKGALYIGGQFNRVNELSNVRSLVRWTGKEYENVPNLNNDQVKYYETILDLSIHDDLLVVAGDFQSSVVAKSENLGFFNGFIWKSEIIKELNSVNGAVHATLSKDGELFLGGKFTRIDNASSPFIARFKSSELIPFENNIARALKFAATKSSVFVAGSISNSNTPTWFFEIDGDTAVKRMEGLTKVSEITDMVAIGDVVIASGSFQISGSGNTYSLIKFSDGKWSALDVGQLSDVNHLLIVNGGLLASGGFETYRAITLNHIAALRVEIKSGLVRGKVYNDKNNNCEFDNRDENLQENLIRIQPGNIIVRPRPDGQYGILLEEGKYTITVTPGKYWSASTCASLSQTIEVVKGEVHEGVDFPLVQQSGIKDLAVNLTSSTGSFAKKNNRQQYLIGFQNLGSSELINGTVSLKFDKRLDNLIAFPPPKKVIGDSAVWNISDLSPGEKGDIRCLFSLKDSADDNLSLVATIAQSEAENDNDNNSSSLTQKIMDEDVEIHKFVNPGTTWQDTAFIPTDAEFIQYQISFSNYTDDTVRSVYVVDTVALSDDIVSIVDIAASHKVIPITIPGPKYSDYAILIYKFENINLAPNPNKLGDMVTDDGYITFQINMSDNLTNGTTFFNKAEVIFDYDFDKITNTVAAIVDNSVSAPTFEVSNTSLRIYPNPTEHSVTIDLPNPVTDNTNYRITNLSGASVQKGDLKTDKTVDVSSLEAGIYLITVEDRNNVYTSRIIKR